MSSSSAPRSRLGAVDPNSYAEAEQIRHTHIELDWQINFDRKTISGTAKYTFLVQDDRNVSRLLLDVDDIAIARIVHDASCVELPFVVSDYVKTIGSLLTIELPAAVGKEFSLTISYETSPSASALQWLTPAQTLDKRHPYMFSQCQHIQARSLLPCQDTPAVKFTFGARVQHDPQLTALMSGVRLRTANGSTEYEQTVPVPSYLLAIAVGEIESRKLGPISNVWAEPSLVDAAAAEFVDTALFLQTAIDICGPYVWHQYDILVMPPSFPLGGMENPCLTFVTPTLITGDRSMVAVIAHEIVHSWSGNLVSNANFEHFWLNEGFTVFVTGKILGRLQGAAARDFDAVRALSELQDTLDGQLAAEPQRSKLVPDLSGPLYPEFSRVPYNKGSTFLRYIEDALGGAALFEPFLRAYFEQFKYKSVVTEQFRGALEEYFKATKAAELATIDWDLWLYGVGMPPVIPQLDDSLALAARERAKLWTEAETVGQIAESPLFANAGQLTEQQRNEMLTQLIAAPRIRALGAKWLALLERTYGLAAEVTRNPELRVRFVRLAVKARLLERLPEVLAFANSNFRWTYVRAVYRDLGAWPEARAAAVANFGEVREQMMSPYAILVAKDLGVE